MYRQSHQLANVKVDIILTILGFTLSLLPPIFVMFSSFVKKIVVSGFAFMFDF